MGPINTSISQPQFSGVDWDETSNESTPIEASRPNTAEKLRKRKELKATRRRIVRACQRCRLRKTRCDGGKPCTRCIEADDVCEYIKCIKKESKEYSQDYVDRLIEQNDQYKRAMRMLYANRRLSIHPDNIVIPATDSEDVPLVHDILERLGLLGEDSGDLPIPSRMESEPESPGSMSTPSISEQHWSPESRPMSLFEASSFDTASSFAEDLAYHNDVLTLPDMDNTAFDLMPLETDMAFDTQYKVFTTLSRDKPNDAFYPLGQDVALFPDMILQSWDQLGSFQEATNGDFPLENSWMFEN